ncbi:radical SAM protein [uncultured Alistipes sp.]|jgi:wyosine [tRNA(Phe)-imidazoG37] synthetase (radical SAM superfamily)|uniref:radical SAM protein n=1 Tax=uncultured Alistipes sp. TaxID=538949 RepID=UPI0025940F2A|nr:radical SAM protein [uncultured Alistipes sp.]
MTSLFPDIIFGPVRSRRLGLSLGVNLLPTRSKLCSFDCIYCECGWNAEHTGARRFNDRDDVRTQLEATLRRMVADGTPPDVITFAGNGEPTLHPDFETVIGDTLALRDALCPGAKVSVLSNATQLHRDDVRRALLRVDNNILKLDSAFDATVRRMNNPQNAAYTVRETVEQMKWFEGRMILQTMFLRGTCGGAPIDNTTEEEVAAWLRLVGEIRPRQVMVYSLDRDTPCPTLEKVPREELQTIAARVEALGIPCSVA